MELLLHFNQAGYEEKPPRQSSPGMWWPSMELLLLVRLKSHIMSHNVKLASHVYTFSLCYYLFTRVTCIWVNLWARSRNLCSCRPINYLASGVSSHMVCDAIPPFNKLTGTKVMDLDQQLSNAWYPSDSTGLCELCRLGSRWPLCSSSAPEVWWLSQTSLTCAVSPHHLLGQVMCRRQRCTSGTHRHSHGPIWKVLVSLSNLIDVYFWGF